MIDPKKESEISKILRLCYIKEKQWNRRMNFLSFIEATFKFDYINECIGCPYIYSDAFRTLRILGGAYNKATMGFLDKNLAIKNLVDSSIDAWRFICLYNPTKHRPETVLLSKTPFLSVFGIVDTINFKSFWFNGNLELIHSFKELGRNLGVQIPHPISSCHGFWNFIWDPYLPMMFSYSVE